MKNLLEKVKKKIFRDREEDDDSKNIIIVDSGEYVGLDDNEKVFSMSSSIFRRYNISTYRYYNLNDYLTIKTLGGRDSGIKNSLYPLNIFNDIDAQEENVAVIEFDVSVDDLLYEFLSNAKFYDVSICLKKDVYYSGPVQSAFAKLKLCDHRNIIFDNKFKR